MSPRSPSWSWRVDLCPPVWLVISLVDTRRRAEQLLVRGPEGPALVPFLSWLQFVLTIPSPDCGRPFQGLPFTPPGECICLSINGPCGTVRLVGSSPPSVVSRNARFNVGPPICFMERGWRILGPPTQLSFRMSDPVFLSAVAFIRTAYFSLPAPAWVSPIAW